MLFLKSKSSSLDFFYDPHSVDSQLPLCCNSFPSFPALDIFTPQWIPFVVVVNDGDDDDDDDYCDSMLNKALWPNKLLS